MIFESNVLNSLVIVKKKAVDVIPVGLKCEAQFSNQTVHVEHFSNVCESRKMLIKRSPKISIQNYRNLKYSYKEFSKEFWTNITEEGFSFFFSWFQFLRAIGSARSSWNGLTKTRRWTQFSNQSRSTGSPRHCLVRFILIVR